MIGLTLKMKLAELARVHRVRPIERPLLPLLAATSKPQMVEGYASTPDLDSDRMVFMKGALSWPADLKTLPLLVDHNLNRPPVGRILNLRYDSEGRLCIKARVDDFHARRLQGFSVSIIVRKSTIHNAESAFHFATIESGLISEVSLVSLPKNSACVVLSRRDVAPIDDRSTDEVIKAALERFKTGLEIYVKSAHRTSPPVQQAPPEQQAPAQAPAQIEIGPAPAHIYGRLPAAILHRKRSPFASLVAHLPVGEEHAR